MKTINLYYERDLWNLNEHPDLFIRDFFSGGRIPRVLSLCGFRNVYIKKLTKEYLIDALENKLRTYSTGKAMAGCLMRRWISGIDFLRTIEPEIDDFLSTYDNLNARYMEFIESTGCMTLGKSRYGRKYVANNLLSGIKSYIFEHAGIGDAYWQRIVWNRNDLPLSEERINPTCAFRTLNFGFITNAKDLECTQRFLWHLITDTNISFSTLSTYYAVLKTFIRYQQEHGRTLNGALREDVIRFYRDYGTRVSNSTFDSRVSMCFSAFEYLCVYGFVESNPFQTSDKHKDPYQYKLKTIDDETILRIFSVLDKIPDRLACMFLLLYSTGMRVSEVCQIRNDSLFKNEKGFFIRFYCQKLKRDAVNPIPEALSERIENIIKENALLPYNEQYLFHSAPNRPYHTSTFSVKLNDAFSPFDIRLPDGRPFIFRPHDFRHTLATKMYLSNIDICVIQGILHHASIEMTMAYVERSDTFMKDKSMKFLNCRGEITAEASDSDRILWMRENLKAQALPNGLCMLPVKLGKCPHANACLDGCEFFRTSKEYLPEHRLFVSRLEAYIDMCARYNWLPQKEAAERVRHNVLEIIGSLEQE